MNNPPTQGSYGGRRRRMIDAVRTYFMNNPQNEVYSFVPVLATI